MFLPCKVEMLRRGIVLPSVLAVDSHGTIDLIEIFYKGVRIGSIVDAKIGNIVQENGRFEVDTDLLVIASR